MSTSLCPTFLVTFAVDYLSRSAFQSFHTVFFRYIAIGSGVSIQASTSAASLDTVFYAAITLSAILRFVLFSFSKPLRAIHDTHTEALYSAIFCAIVANSLLLHELALPVLGIIRESILTASSAQLTNIPAWSPNLHFLSTCNPRHLDCTT